MSHLLSCQSRLQPPGRHGVTGVQTVRLNHHKDGIKFFRADDQGQIFNDIADEGLSIFRQSYNTLQADQKMSGRAALIEVQVGKSC